MVQGKKKFFSLEWSRRFINILSLKPKQNTHRYTHTFLLLLLVIQNAVQSY